MRKRASSDIDRALRRIAEKQLGLVSAAQAAHAGIGWDALAHRRSTGMLVPVFPRVMRLAGVELPPHQRLLAASLAVSNSCVAGPSAGAILGLPVGKQYAQDVSTVPVILSVPNPMVVRVQGIVAVRFRSPLPSRPWMGARISTPAATILTLPRFVDNATVERCLDHCLTHRLLTVKAVCTLIEAQPYRSVARRGLLLDLLHARAGGIGHRSGLEQRTGRWLTEGGLGGWHSNYRVLLEDGEVVEVDFAWVTLKVALEVSPFFTHGSEAGQLRDVVRRRLLVRAGWTVIEASDPELVNRAAFQAVLLDLKRQLVH